MDPAAAKLIAAGLATVGVGLAAVGVGIVYATASEKSKTTGLLLTSGLGLACLLNTIMLLFGV